MIFLLPPGVWFGLPILTNNENNEENEKNMAPFFRKFVNFVYRSYFTGVIFLSAFIQERAKIAPSLFVRLRMEEKCKNPLRENSSPNPP